MSNQLSYLKELSKIYSGEKIIFDKLKQGKIIYKKEYNNKNKEKRVSKMILNL